METRNPGEHGDTGLGEVRSHLSQPGRTPGASGTSGMGYPGGSGLGQTGQSTSDRAGAMVDDAKDRAEDAVHQVRAKAGELRDRAEDTLDDARSRAGQAISRAEAELEERTGVISMIRDNPIPALGVAVAVGYLAAGSRRKKRGRVMNMATGQLRGAIIAGVSAALAREFRSIMSEQGGSLASLFGGDNETRSTKSSTARSGMNPSSTSGINARPSSNF
ncbi:hypothetical protein BH23GEM6_BH23GEM6_00470 [soil metagenome]